MANVFGTASTGNMQIRRLRSPDASYLVGATLPVLGSYPIAACFGTTVESNTVAVPAGDWWVKDYPIPAAPDIVWAMVRAQIVLQSDGTPGVPQSMHLFARGAYADDAAARAPVWGNLAWSEVLVANAGSYPYRVVASYPDAHNPANTYWCPLDPALTKDGWNLTLSIHADGTTGAAIGEWATDPRDWLLLGYPVNLWGTGPMWAPMTQRGV